MIAEVFGIESRTPAMLAIVGILVFGFYYAAGRINVGPLLLLGAMAVALIAVAVAFVGRMSDPDESMKQTRYKADRPPRRFRRSDRSAAIRSNDEQTLGQHCDRAPLAHAARAVAWVYEYAGPHPRWDTPVISGSTNIAIHNISEPQR